MYRPTLTTERKEMMSPEWDAKNPRVPVDKDGNWQAFPMHYNTDRWVNVLPWVSRMTIDGMRTGRSSKVVVLKDDAGVTYPMFVADLVKGIQEGTLNIDKGTITAVWTASKRGANYGIKATL